MWVDQESLDSSEGRDEPVRTWRDWNWSFVSVWGVYAVVLAIGVGLVMGWV